MKCAVLNCSSNNFGKASKCSFFGFPSDKTLLKKWISFCRRGNLFNPKTAHICMLHFASADFENNQKYEMGYTTKRSLKRGVIPTIYKISDGNVERAERMERRENKQLVAMLLRDDVGRYEANESIVVPIEDSLEVAEGEKENSSPKSSTSKDHSVEEIITLEKQIIGEMELCRLCGNFVDDTNSQNLLNLFETKQRDLLRQAEELTGLELKNYIELAQFVCQPCQKKTQLSHEFRERCIRVQTHFAKAAAYVNQHLETPALANRNQPTPTKQNLTNIQKADTIERLDDEQEELLEDVEEEEDDDYDYDDDDDDVPQEYGADDDKIRVTNEVLNPDSEDDNSGSCYSLSFDYPDTPDNKDTTPGTTDLINLPPPKQPSDIKVMEAVAQLIEKDSYKYKPKRMGKQKQICVCDQCGKHFRCQFYLTIHMRRHTGEKPFACKTCDRRFFSNGDRLVHEIVHKTERPYVCGFCGRGFNAKQVLTNHELTHTGERPFICTLCNVSFNRKALLKMHLKSGMHEKVVNQQQQLDIHTNMIFEDDPLCMSL